MIVQITMFKDERPLLEALLPIWKKYADGFIFFDDDSSDGSYEFLITNKEKYNILEVIKGPERTINDTLAFEKEHRQPMFDKALKYTNKIICLDSDEYFDGTMTKNELESILEQNKDTVLFFRWVQYTSYNTIRIDGPWANNWKDRASSYSSHKLFGNNYSHLTHLPETGKSLVIDPNKLFIAHLQWLNKPFVALKQYNYKVYDWVVNNLYGIQVAGPEAVDGSVNNFNWEEEYFDYPLKIREDFYENQNIFDTFRFKYIIEKTKKYNIPNLGDWDYNLMDLVPMYFCLASDEKHFLLLMNLIGSLHKLHFFEIMEISVYDLGLNDQQKRELNNIKKVKICEVEKTNSQILESIETGVNRKVRGLFSWKPVIIKQALDKYPYVVYLDAGSTVLKSLRGLFKHIIEHGYFLSDNGQTIVSQTGKNIIKKFSLDSDENKWILQKDVYSIDAGFMGVSKKYYDNFVFPMYKLSFDIENFVDDGTCEKGWGWGRHDQTLYSILVKQLNLKVYNHDRDVNECFVEYQNKKEPFVITHNINRVDDNTVIFRSRWNINPVTFKNYVSEIKRKYVVSVITAIGHIKDYGKFIDQYFSDIQNQILFQRTEHVIIFSEWTDIFDKYKNFENIIFIQEDKKCGMYYAWNLGIQNASAEYVTNWNIDDRRHPLNIKIKYDLLNLNREYDLAYNYYVASTTNEDFNNLNLENRSIIPFPDDYHLYVLQNCLAGPDPMWRKSLHLFVGYFNFEQYKIVADWDMWIRFALNGSKFKLIPEVLCIFNVHENNVTGKELNLQRENLMLKQSYEKFKK